MVIWVIEHGIFDNEQKLIDEVRKQRHDVIEIDYVSNYYIDDICRNPQYHKLLNNPVIFKGSLNLSREVSRITDWIPGTYCNLNNFNCSTYYTYWGKYMLNREYWLIPINQVFNNKFIEACLYGIHDDNVPEVFIRPNSGMKQFTGRIFNLSNLSSLKNIDPETLVLVAPVKKISKEWRFVVTGNEIVSGSIYLPYKSDNVDYSVIDYLQNVLNDLRFKWQPDFIYTVDVCQSNGEFYILELNSFSCSNLYSCNLAAVVEVASQLAINDWNEYAA